MVASKGTYVRSLAADLGEAVGSAAHLTALRREAVGATDAGVDDLMAQLAALGGGGK